MACSSASPSFVWPSKRTLRTTHSAGAAATGGAGSRYSAAPTWASAAEAALADSQALFSRGYSYYDNGGYDFATMCGAALTFHNEQGLAFAQKLKANMPGTAKSVDQIFAIMNAAGGGEPGRIAALVDMANDPATEAAIAASNVRVTGIVADLEVPGFGTLFGLLPGG